MAAASGIPVEAERMWAFARACLEVSEVGRLALAVLDGGVFAPRRALELVRLVSDADRDDAFPSTCPLTRRAP